MTWIITHHDQAITIRKIQFILVSALSYFILNYENVSNVYKISHFLGKELLPATFLVQYTARFSSVTPVATFYPIIVISRVDVFPVFLPK